MTRSLAAGWVAVAVCLLPALLPAHARADDLDDADSDTPRAAFAVGVNGLIPLEGYADRQVGGGIEAGFGVVFERALLHGSVGIRNSIADGDDKYLHLPFETSLAYLFSAGENTPLLGGGVGLYYLYELVSVTRTVGTVLRSTSSDLIEDDTFGAGLFARAGVLLARECPFSWLLTADYSLIVASFQERASEHALRLNVVLLIGGR